MIIRRRLQNAMMQAMGGEQFWESKKLELSMQKEDERKREANREAREKAEAYKYREDQVRRHMGSIKYYLMPKNRAKYYEVYPLPKKYRVMEEQERARAKREKQLAEMRKKKAAQEWNREMENQGGSRPGSAFTWADATPRDTARSESHFSPRGGLDTARSDATDVSDISDAGRFVDEFDADDKQDVEKLFRAVRHGRRDAIRQYTEKGFDVNLRNKHGHTLAMVAAQNNQKAILKQLYRFGLADSINDQDYKGNTALHYAQMYGYTQLAEYMVSKLGADETLVNRDGASAWINVEEATEVAD